MIGIHVSTAGGLDRAVERGVEREADAIQVFNQSPRAWRPTRYSDADFAAFREAIDGSRIDAVVIHAIYLINLATPDREVRRKSTQSLAHALRVGDGIGADGVVVHAGSRKDTPHADALKRAGKAIDHVLGESESCPLLLENTAGTQGPLGRNFDELADLIEHGGGGKRLGVCVDCCHLFASGFEIGTPGAMTLVVDELDAKLGLDRVRCLHVNDSAAPQGSNRDRHADLGAGEMGKAGLRPFLSEPRFEDLPALIETNKSDDPEHDRKEVRAARRLRREGLKRRG
ncbi:MAG: deoxyribonuclease IV [Solirubrobacterales bacterium]